MIFFCFTLYMYYLFVHYSLLEKTVVVVVVYFCLGWKLAARCSCLHGHWWHVVRQQLLRLPQEIKQVGVCTLWVRVRREHVQLIWYFGLITLNYIILYANKLSVLQEIEQEETFFFLQKYLEAKSIFFKIINRRHLSTNL